MSHFAPRNQPRVHYSFTQGSRVQPLWHWDLFSGAVRYSFFGRSCHCLKALGGSVAASMLVDYRAAFDIPHHFGVPVLATCWFLKRSKPRALPKLSGKVSLCDLVLRYIRNAEAMSSPSLSTTK
eukprot:3440273-Amphidinium_carterae.1